MTNEVGKALFSRAGELGVPVGFMCMKVCGYFLAQPNKLLEFNYILALTVRSILS